MDGDDNGVQLRSLSRTHEASPLVTEIVHGGVEHTSSISRDSGEFTSVIGSTFVYSGKGPDHNKQDLKVDEDSLKESANLNQINEKEGSIISGSVGSEEVILSTTERTRPEGSSPTQSDSESPDVRRVHFGDPNADDILPVSLADFVMKSVVERRESMKDAGNENNVPGDEEGDVDENGSEMSKCDTLITVVTDEADTRSELDEMANFQVEDEEETDNFHGITDRREEDEIETDVYPETREVAPEQASLNSDATLDIRCESPEDLDKEAENLTEPNQIEDSVTKHEKHVHFDMHPVQINSETTSVQYKKPDGSLNQTKHYKSKLEKWPKSDTFTTISQNLKGGSMNHTNSSLPAQKSSLIRNQKDDSIVHTSRGLELQQSSEKEGPYRKKAHWYCCCGLGWFMVGVVALAAGAVLVVYLRPYWKVTGEITLDRQLLYFGAALCALGGLCVLVSMGLWTGACLMWEPRRTAKQKRRQAHPAANKYKVESGSSGNKGVSNGQVVQNGSVGAQLPHDTITVETDRGIPANISYVQCVEYKEAERDASRAARQEVFLM